MLVAGTLDAKISEIVNSVMDGLALVMVNETEPAFAPGAVARHRRKADETKGNSLAHKTPNSVVPWATEETLKRFKPITSECPVSARSNSQAMAVCTKQPIYISRRIDFRTPALTNNPPGERFCWHTVFRVCYNVSAFVALVTAF